MLQTAAIGYTFNGVYTAGAGGNFTVSNNTIGSASTTNSISIGSGSTTAICTMRGIYNTATGAISLTGNTIQNCSVYGTGALFYMVFGIQVVLEQWTLIPTK
jgi:ABC-type branched-subunit amino acid transport system ATPase component